MKNLRKIIFCLTLFAVMATGSIFAQDDDDNYDIPSRKFAHEINLGYGAPHSLITAAIPLLTGIIVAPVSGGRLMLPKGPGVFHVGYNWYPLEWLSIGATGTFEPYKLILDDNSTMEDTYSYLWSAQGKVSIHYGGGDLVKIYHSLSGGVSFMSTPEEALTTMPAFNLTLIGVEIGKDNGFYGFGDLNLGLNAFFNIGVGYRFAH